MIKWNYIIIYPETQHELGLFDDLKKNNNVQLIMLEHKNIKGILFKILKKIHTSWSINKYVRLPFKNVWYKRPIYRIKNNQMYCVVIIDTALKMLNVSELNYLFKKSNVRGVLALINSMDAQSISMLENRKKIEKIKWHDIYTFDSEDASRYGYKNLGQCYYSMKDPELLLQRNKKVANVSDAYFVGGLKGGREEAITALYNKLDSCKVTANFNIMLVGKERVKKHLFENKIHYYSRGWIPYEEILLDVLNTNVIIEILQNGQHGPSLRYFEAVCYNKKLLTTNTDIVNYPYYDSKYMKVFYSVDDIDINWVKEKENIDYHYQGEFSPFYLLETVIK